jgi:hypothetical protein
VLVAYDLVLSDPQKSVLPQLPQAALTEAQHARLQQLEDESDLVLMAYQK